MMDPTFPPPPPDYMDSLGSSSREDEPIRTIPISRDPTEDDDPWRTLEFTQPKPKESFASYYQRQRAARGLAPEPYPPPEVKEDDEPTSSPIIQILLPCIICNRTFSPEALERHSKICTKVHSRDAKLKERARGTFDSHTQRIKDTPVAHFIPPPQATTDPDLGESGSWFSRGTGSRSSLKRSGSILRSSFRRETSLEPPRTQYGSEFGGGEGQDSCSVSEAGGRDVPSYARALSPTEDCPYCLRSFGIKAYERHLNFCRELWERRQFEIQPPPKELEQARERQEVRTKYNPGARLKGSWSMSSLRSMSPSPSARKAFDFSSSMLTKLFGRGGKGSSKEKESPDLLGSSFNKQSNESLASSCYGDLNRGLGYRSIGSSNYLTGRPPLGSRPPGGLSRQHSFCSTTSSKAPSRIPVLSKTKSTDFVPGVGSMSTVSSSGYGPGGHYMGNFGRGSRARSTLSKDFFSRKRVEPEGKENTLGGVPNSSNLYSSRRTTQSGINKYDPYELAAQQLEELLRTQTLSSSPDSRYKNGANYGGRTQRKIGLERALASVHTPGLDSSTKSKFWTMDSDWDSWYDGSGEISKEPMGSRSYHDWLKPSYYGSTSYPIRSMDSEFEALENFLNSSGEPSSTHSSKSKSMAKVAPEPRQSNTSLNSACGGTESPGSPPANPDKSHLEFKSEPRSSVPNRTYEFEDEGSRSRFSASANEDPGHITSTFGSSPRLCPTPARFCHECGSPYPNAKANFCPECGQRRIINV